MKLLNWNNLRKMLCPYCDSKLTEDLEIRCSKCVFHIEKDKFKSIVAHRGMDVVSITRMRWQNLVDNKCPVDGFELFTNTNQKFEVFMCTAPNCTFKIRNDRLQLILNDPTHPANVYYKKTI